MPSSINVRNQLGLFVKREIQVEHTIVDPSTGDPSSTPDKVVLYYDNCSTAPPFDHPCEHQFTIQNATNEYLEITMMGTASADRKYRLKIPMGLPFTILHDSGTPSTREWMMEAQDSYLVIRIPAGSIPEWKLRVFAHASTEIGLHGTPNVTIEDDQG